MNDHLRTYLNYYRKPGFLSISISHPGLNRIIDAGIGTYAYLQGYLFRVYKFLRIFLSLSISLSLSLVFSQDTDTYIRNYKDIAVAEMFRTGIPASIKLAQGIVESNCGCSELAHKANNHFGIKCGGDWTGKSFHKEDDDYIDGELTKSCFREFSSPMESFIAHSDFLTDPKKSARYGTLFQLEATDYKGWAKGLSKAGYATDPNYSDKLIKIIEDNRLYDLDTDNASLASANPNASIGSALIRTQNDADYAVAIEGDNVAAISERYHVKKKNLLQYNDHAFDEYEILEKGTKVYLEPKRSKFHGKQKSYVLKPGEDLVFVAQQYGIKLSALQKRNGIEGTAVPASGQKIMLKGRPKQPLKTQDPYQLPDEVPSTPKKNEVTENPDTSDKVVPSPVTIHQQADTTRITKSTQPASAGEHTVAKGETLFSIARDFGLSIDELKKRNNLSVDTIHIGQKLVIK